MDCKDHTTVQAERKRGQHLGPEERDAIKALKKQGFDVRAIPRAIGCAPSTVTNELERGTPPPQEQQGEKAPGYSPKRGEAVYKAHRANSCRPRKADSCKPLIAWVVKQVREHKKCYGTSSSDRPETAAQREGGTVVGKRAGHEAVALTLLEKKTENYLAIRIPGKTSKAVMHVMAALRAEKLYQ